MKRLKKGERGFTLIELIIVVAIAGVVASAITGTTLYMLNLNVSLANRMAAVRQVRNVGFWISPDVQMAQCVYYTETEFLKLTWIEWEEPSYSHEVIYTLVDMPDGLARLQRSHSVNGGAPTVTIIAEYIDPAETSRFWDCECDCYWDEGCEDWYDAQLTFEVTATVGEQSETRVYEVKPRPGSQ